METIEQVIAKNTKGFITKPMTKKEIKPTKAREPANLSSQAD